MINPKLNKNTNPIDVLNIDPKFLWFLTLTYSMLSLLSSWFSICTISLREIPINAGILILPATLLLSNSITEIYGYKYARRALWYSFLFNVLSILFGSWVIYLPSPNYAVHNSLFDSVITTYLKNIYIFFISYFIIEPFNIFFLAKSKSYMNGYHMKLRLGLSAILSMIIILVIFSILKLNGPVLTIELIPTSLIITIIMLFFLLIFSYFVKKIKQLEKIDIYDNNTQFNFFKFEIKYINKNNKFDQLTN